MKKEVFSFTGTNAAAIGTGAIIAIQNQTTAAKHGHLPHNSMMLSNMSGTCTIFGWFDNPTGSTAPDFVLFNNKTMNIHENEGYHWTTLFLKNTHAANDVAIAEIKYRISTVAEVV